MVRWICVQLLDYSVCVEYRNALSYVMSTHYVCDCKTGSFLHIWIFFLCDDSVALYTPISNRIFCMQPGLVTSLASLTMHSVAWVVLSHLSHRDTTIRPFYVIADRFTRDFEYAWAAALNTEQRKNVYVLRQTSAVYRIVLYVLPVTKSDCCMVSFSFCFFFLFGIISRASFEHGLYSDSRLLGYEVETTAFFEGLFTC